MWQIRPLFVYFRLYQKTATKIMQIFAINGKVRWCCALDSNLWPQYRRNRQILCAMMASDWSTFVCCLFIKICFNLILSNNPYHYLFNLWISIFWIVFKQNGPFRAIFSSFQFRCQRELKIKFVFFSNRAIRLCCCPLLLRSSLDWMGKKFFEPEMSEWCFRQQLGWLPSYLLLVSLFHFPVFV